MEKIDQIKKSITELINSSKDENLTKGLGTVLGELDLVEEEHNGLIERHNSLIKDYGKLVIQVGTKEAPVESEQPHVKTMEDVLKDINQKDKK